MASRAAALGRWGSTIGPSAREKVAPKWLRTDAPETWPLLTALTFGICLSLTTIAYQLAYNPTILCARARARGYQPTLRRTLARHDIGFSRAG